MLVCDQGVAAMVATHGERDIPGAMPITLSTEAGHLGGIPAGGKQFGAAHNAAAHMPMASMIDLYQGGGVDIAFLGMAEVILDELHVPMDVLDVMDVFCLPVP